MHAKFHLRNYKWLVTSPIQATRSCSKFQAFSKFPGKTARPGTLPGADRCICSDSVLDCFFVRFTLGGNFGAGFALKRIFLIFSDFFGSEGHPPMVPRGVKCQNFEPNLSLLTVIHHLNSPNTLKYP